MTCSPAIPPAGGGLRHRAACALDIGSSALFPKNMLHPSPETTPFFSFTFSPCWYYK
jgi:hypothetical protein